MKKYSELTIDQKINAKTSALNYGRYYETLCYGWYPMRADFVLGDLIVYRSDKIYTFNTKQKSKEMYFMKRKDWLKKNNLHY